MLDSIKRVPRASLSDNIVEQILHLISRGVLKPGDQIPSEKQLCQQLGVGRTSVREALRSLSFMGILNSHAGEGTFVAKDGDKYLEKTLQRSLLLTRKAVDDLVETRVMLESQTAFLAAQRASDPDLEDMSAALEGMATCIGQPEPYLEFDLRFHMTIARASQNSILCQLLGMIRGYLQTWIQQVLTTPVPGQAELRAIKSVAEHRAILSALAGRDAEQAREAMIEHLFSSRRDFTERSRTGLRSELRTAVMHETGRRRVSRADRTRNGAGISNGVLPRHGENLRYLISMPIPRSGCLWPASSGNGTDARFRRMASAECLVLSTQNAKS